MDDAEMIRFFIDEKAQFELEIGEPVGDVPAGVFVKDDGFTVCFAVWGGWLWKAQSPDDDTARRRLEDRLRQCFPFAGADWGPPGRRTGDPLSESIPPATRETMLEFDPEAFDPDEID